MNSEELAWLLRRHVIEMTHVAEASHIGSNLSIADIVAVLYNDIANINYRNYQNKERDRIVLSKGHASAIIYAVLAEMGFYDRKELMLHCANGSRFSAMISNTNNPGVEMATGSLGHGLPVAVGMAFAAKKDNRNHKVFAILGDGECNEGSIWESALTAQQLQLDNLIAIVDHNKLQCLDFCENIINMAPFVDKWKSFGWDAVEIDGHDHSMLKTTLTNAKNIKNIKPQVIIAHTIKGKGISFMENNVIWHYRFPHPGEEYNTSIAELQVSKPKSIKDPYKK